MLDLSNNWPWLAAIGAALAAGWGVLRGLFDWFTTLFVGQVEIPDSYYTRRAVEYFLWYHCQRVSIGTTCITNQQLPLRTGQYDDVMLETLPKRPVLFLYGKIPLIVQVTSSNHDDDVSIRYIRGTVKPEKLLQEVYRCFKQYSHAQRFEIIRMSGSHGQGGGFPHDGRPSAPRVGHSANRLQISQRLITHQHEELGLRIKASTLADLSLPAAAVEYVEEAREWARSRVWYQERGIPWRRGWILQGRPGTGKTTLVKAMGSELNIPVYVYDLGTMTNSDLTSSWEDMMANAPCIALIEDIDAVFNGRENLTKTITGGLTFDCLLNCIAGVGTGDGVFTIITTNDMSRIDPALACVGEAGDVSRPGRVDRIIHLDGLTDDGAAKICRRILPDLSADEAQKLVEAGRGETVAQFTERCVRQALHRRWEQHQ